MDSSYDKTIIGYISKANAVVMVVDENGIVRIADIGDPLYLNERVINDSTSSVIIELINDQLLNLPDSQQVTMHVDLLNSPALGSSDEDQVEDVPASDYDQPQEQIIQPEQVLAPETDDGDTADQIKPVEDTFAREAIIDRLVQAERVDSSTDKSAEIENDFLNLKSNQKTFNEVDQRVVEHLPPQVKDLFLTITEDLNFSFDGVQFSSTSTIQSITIICKFSITAG
ncbi:hypothetical protein [Endozoicomonas sp. Mp262]|uniref:hypothetical protein n=1 Tax=Endozoicomonas sp. Mp262 TaxID=2919499 RepID=UPI0021DF74AF